MAGASRDTGDVVINTVNVLGFRIQSGTKGKRKTRKRLQRGHSKCDIIIKNVNSVSKKNAIRDCC